MPEIIIVQVTEQGDRFVREVMMKKYMRQFFFKFLLILLMSYVRKRSSGL